jgi:hypothetical protein
MPSQLLDEFGGHQNLELEDVAWLQVVQIIYPIPYAVDFISCVAMKGAKYMLPFFFFFKKKGLCL